MPAHCVACNGVLSGKAQVSGNRIERDAGCDKVLKPVGARVRAIAGGPRRGGRIDRPASF
jgi:hypothetical protein